MDFGEMEVMLSEVDPDAQASIKIAFGYQPEDWFGLGRVECAADLPVVIGIKMLSKTKQLHVMQLEFMGKSIDLLVVLARIKAWSEQFPTVPYMSVEEFRARDSFIDTSGPTIGFDEPSV